MTGRPIAGLPLTSRHAFQVARSLGIRYLWIDRLCIIQDDEEDWREQVSLMGDIFSKAVCCLAATASIDAHGGIFRCRSLEDPDLRHNTVELPDRRTNSASYVISDSEIFQKQVGDMNLNRRGWVYQERILSPCVIHFGSKQVYFECHEILESENQSNILRATGHIKKLVTLLLAHGRSACPLLIVLWRCGQIGSIHILAVRFLIITIKQ